MDQANIELQEVSILIKEKRVEEETQFLIEKIEDQYMYAMGPRAFGPDQ